MKPRVYLAARLALVAVATMAGCSKSAPPAGSKSTSATAPIYFKVDPSTAGSLSGSIRYMGPRPRPKLVDMSNEPACVDANHAKVYEDSLVVGPHDGLANAFVYIKLGLEGKTFAPAQTHVIIDQKGCWFRPHVLGMQTGRTLQIINSDPVTHNIHPMPQVNREWNHSQGAGDPPMNHKFAKAEVMIPVKCNIHSWMHAYVGVLDHPYFAVTKEDGKFAIGNLPPGTYTLAVWTQTLGTQQQTITVAPGGNARVDFTFHRK
jgi:plastocyanin